MFDFKFANKKIAKDEFENNIRNLNRVAKKFRDKDKETFRELYNINDGLSKVYFTLFNINK